MQNKRKKSIQMKVTFHYIRILHLLLLIILTIIFGQILIQRYEWTSLTAYGLSCSIVCQINSIVLNYQDISNNLLEEQKNNDNDSVNRKKKRK